MDIELSYPSYTLVGPSCDAEGQFCNMVLFRLEPDAELFTQVFSAESFSAIHLPLRQKGEALFQIMAESLIAAPRDCFSVQLAMQPLSLFEWEAITAQPVLEIKPNLNTV